MSAALVNTDDDDENVDHSMRSNTDERIEKNKKRKE